MWSLSVDRQDLRGQLVSLVSRQGMSNRLSTGPQPKQDKSGKVEYRSDCFDHQVPDSQALPLQGLLDVGKDQAKPFIVQIINQEEILHLLVGDKISTENLK